MLRSRRKAREAALQALYGCDLINDWSDEMIALYFQLHHPGAEADQSTREHFYFSRHLVRGVREQLTLIDRHIASVSVNWSIARMCRIDRNIIRCAAFEIGFVPEVPVNVTINEAIEIAKEYGGDESPTFVNGLLDKLARRMRVDEALRAVMATKGGSPAAVNE